MPIHKYVNFFGTMFPWYGVCSGIGLLMIGIWILFCFKKLKLTAVEQNEFLCGFPFMVIFGVLIAFALDAFFTGDWRTWTSQMERRIGFTYTGWLLGVIVFLLVYGKFTSLGGCFLLNMLLPSFALAQSIGRVGCFLSGCCYGQHCGWGVRYPLGSLPYEHMGDVTIFPVQLVEAISLLALFVICIRNPFWLRGGVYLVGVGVIRFIIEFFRADVRGSFCGITVLSPQQIMSCGFMVLGIILLSLRSPKGSAIRVDRNLARVGPHWWSREWWSRAAVPI